MTDTPTGPAGDPTGPDTPTDGPTVPAGLAGDPTGPTAPGRSARASRRTARLTAAVGLVLGTVAVAFVARSLVRDWDEAESAIRDARLGWIVAALVLAVAAMVAIAVVWRSVFALLGVRARVDRVIAWYFVGELGKYLPGGVWPVLGRGELARRGGVPRVRAYASVGLSLVLLYLTAMFVAVAFLPFALAGSGADGWMLILAALPVGVLALHHAVLERFVAFATRISGREIDVRIPRWGESLTVILHYVPSWLLVGASTWAVARALDPNASFARVVFAAVLSWIAGFLAVPVPAGAGVREAVIVATSGLGGGVAAATAIVARLLFGVADGVGAAVGAALLRRRGGGAVGPLPGEEPGSGPVSDR